ncbi:DUF4376 domain-containing protein [Leptospira borgpetersenii]|uniref:DUF4376 domain-containing protein n=1 Tax=Leptospira borgpetersenii TaxID=174 RepID=UPI000773E1C9|nr:hypothetical protein [Leptospira borgpetersenii]MBE8400997.1 hypothetical protein [Leptospira borgpetersenii serovar Tarassovi]MBE8404029.1 hypothetical protein [Leptospira borgpetersenii serovar Tarassovi]MBE8407090.1 hypothetical protein [Leptospira borgpetersenii serovar Tarassovi]MBE8413872.1 hypothetical protein [Leptospira borgpetersenii serovar Tarassovi]MBE8416683.1 hypothetical protein [Leptospira borgpetersenii serovar Tarassovi]
MNYVIEKHSNIVIWMNTAPNQLTGVETWANFNPDQHEIVYSLHYNPHIGETFRAKIRDGVAQDFTPEKVYNKITGAVRILQNWEDEINPETETNTEPLRNEDDSLLTYQIYTETDGWIVDLVKKKDYLIKLVNSICESKITAGFVSSALGAPHVYSSDRDDQLNLIGLVSLNSSVSYKCMDQRGVKTYRNHSADQIKQVLNDGAAQKAFLLQNSARLKLLLQSANTIEELDQIEINSGWE